MQSTGIPFFPFLISPDQQISNRSENNKRTRGQVVNTLLSLPSSNCHTALSDSDQDHSTSFGNARQQEQSGEAKGALGVLHGFSLKSTNNG